MKLSGSVRHTNESIDSYYEIKEQGGCVTQDRIKIDLPFSREYFAVSYSVGMISLRDIPVCFSDHFSVSISRYFQNFVRISGGAKCFVSIAYEFQRAGVNIH